MFSTVLWASDGPSKPNRDTQTWQTHAPVRKNAGVAAGDVSAPKRLLVVVDRAIADPASLPASVLLAERQADEVYVVAPVLTSWLEYVTDDDGRATADAEHRLALVLRRMRATQGVAASGRVGDESPIASIDDALANFAADEIVIVRSDDQRHWHERHLAEKARRRYSQPLTEVVVHADGSASIRSTQTGNG